MKQTYNYKKTLQKGGIILLEIIILGTISYVTNIPELNYLLPILEMGRNYLKHRE